MGLLGGVLGHLYEANAVRAFVNSVGSVRAVYAPHLLADIPLAWLLPCLQSKENIKKNIFFFG